MKRDGRKEGDQMSYMTVAGSEGLGIATHVC